MGVQRVVRHGPAAGVDWPRILERLGTFGESVSLRMIDGLPAFPDEVPDPAWRELRLSFPSGMVTLRRVPEGSACIVWGNADQALLCARDRLCWAYADATGGVVEADDGSALSAAEFAAAYLRV